MITSPGIELTPAEQERQLQLQMSARSPDLMRFTGGLWWSLLPASSLAGHSVGVSGEWPDHYRHAGASMAQTVARVSRPNPLLRSVGAFDLTLLVGAILPLAVITLTFDVAAADREQGRWGLVRAHASSLPRLIISRCFVRVGALALLVIVLTASSVLILPTGQWDAAAVGNVLIWGAWLSAYMAFWATLAILSNALPLSASGAGLLLLLSWFITVIAVPTVVERVINRSERMSQQSELLAFEADVRRQSELEADEVWAEFREQHPEIQLDQESPQQEQLLRDMALSEVIRSRVRTRTEAYFRRFLNRDDVLDRLQLLTPLLAWRTAADQCAGTSLRHYVEFAQQTAAFHEEFLSCFEPMSLDGRELSLSDIQNIPQFDARQLQRRLHLPPLLLSAVSLATWIAACGFMARWCFRRNANQ
ncbi:MAG: DUF3526 domain-containing protein [Planctomycetaceae bacterium]|nr:DUF3526 domain-containing protein [Planctomycetaceae bacterium]